MPGILTRLNLTGRCWSQANRQVEIKKDKMQHTAVHFCLAVSMHGLEHIDIQQKRYDSDDYCRFLHALPDHGKVLHVQDGAKIAT